jgi:hypothetical protein
VFYFFGQNSWIAPFNYLKTFSEDEYIMSSNGNSFTASVIFASLGLGVFYTTLGKRPKNTKNPKTYDVINFISFMESIKPKIELEVKTEDNETEVKTEDNEIEIKTEDNEKIPVPEKVIGGIRIAIVKNDPINALGKIFIPNKRKRSQDFHVSKRSLKLAISISLPVSPSLRGIPRKTRSAPTSPIMYGICITPPNSPTLYDTVVEGRWLLVPDYYSED